MAESDFVECTVECPSEDFLVEPYLKAFLRLKLPSLLLFREDRRFHQLLDELLNE